MALALIMTHRIFAQQKNYFDSMTRSIHRDTKCNQIVIELTFIWLVFICYLAKCICNWSNIIYSILNIFSLNYYLHIQTIPIKCNIFFDSNNIFIFFLNLSTFHRIVALFRRLEKANLYLTRAKTSFWSKFQLHWINPRNFSPLKMTLAYG